MISNVDAYHEDKEDALMYEGSLHHLTRFTQRAVSKMKNTVDKARAMPNSDENELAPAVAAADQEWGHTYALDFSPASPSEKSNA